MYGAEQSGRPFLRRPGHAIPQDANVSAGLTIANNNLNMNTHSGTGNIFNYNPVTNNVFNATMPQESVNYAALGPTSWLMVMFAGYYPGYHRCRSETHIIKID